MMENNTDDKTKTCWLYPRVSLYALMLAAGGIPLYIHLPLFATTSLGISLATVGAILLFIRLIDLVQDPLIGWAIDRWPNAQLRFAMLAAGGLAVGFPLLYSLSPGGPVAVFLTLLLILLYSAYSLGMILLYGRSATLADTADRASLLRVAAFREGGMLAGVVIAAIAPSVFNTMGAERDGYPAFGLMLGIIAIIAALLTRPMWKRPVVIGQTVSLSTLKRAGALRLLVIALVNSLPVALTSTLFLFFVEDRLGTPKMAGPLLVLFFISAGVAVPVWTKLSTVFGEKQTLLIAMPLAVAGFVGAAFLGTGDILAFAVISIASGAALGADMVILPAMFSVALTNAGLKASLAFGIWSIAGKLGLALAAFFALPLLEWRGFVPGGPNPPQALATLTFAYALLPCALKMVAIAMVLRLPDETPS